MELTNTQKPQTCHICLQTTTTETTTETITVPTPNTSMVLNASPTRRFHTCAECGLNRTAATANATKTEQHGTFQH